MDAHTVMEEWEPRSFDGGYRGLADLRTAGFSGAVEADDARLFFRSGDPIAVVSGFPDEPRPGDVEAFEGASGTAHAAPEPAAATLAAMLVVGGDVRGKYYSDDTPLSKVHETLADGGFTGYVELSENVLSGDYYVVYEDGAADHVAFLGSARLVVGEEAERKAQSEIGIYSVVAVDLPDVRIPEPEPDVEAEPESEAGVGPESGPDSESTPETGVASGAGSTPTPVSEIESGGGSDAVPESEPTSDPESVPEPEVTSDPDAIEEPEPDADREPKPEPDDEHEPEPEPEPGTASDSESVDESPEPGSDSPAMGPETDDDPAADPLEAVASSAAEGTDSSAADIDGVTSRMVPSLDPERSGRASDETGPDPRKETRSASNRRTAAEREPERPRPDAETRREEREAELESLRSEIEALRTELEEARSERADLRAERNRLRERVEELRSAGGSAGSTAPGETSLSAPEALSGTSLFVREGSRDEATLEDAHAGGTDREALAENLRIEHHTRFDDAEAVVDGEPFERFLRESLSFRFSEWIVTDLLFEIRSTGSESGMRTLYDALPKIDRVGFREAVDVGGDEEIQFDVVVRDRMGEPLVVADLDTTRDPTKAGAMRPLIDNATDVVAANESLAGAFSVTASYFDPDALDVSREATSGSLLSRDRYRSYVKFSRGVGYHLCLVEARDGSFHLTVPEL